MDENKIPTFSIFPEKKEKKHNAALQLTDFTDYRFYSFYWWSLYTFPFIFTQTFINLKADNLTFGFGAGWNPTAWWSTESVLVTNLYLQSRALQHLYCIHLYVFRPLNMTVLTGANICQQSTARTAIIIWSSRNNHKHNGPRDATLGFCVETVLHSELHSICPNFLMRCDTALKWPMWVKPYDGYTDEVVIK